MYTCPSASSRLFASEAKLRCCLCLCLDAASFPCAPVLQVADARPYVLIGSAQDLEDSQQLSKFTVCREEWWLQSIVNG